MQEVQHHPLSGKVLHVDFHEVSETEKVTVMVPVETVGEAVGVKTGGGVLEHVLFKLKVRALPKDLPEQILVDVSALEVGKSIHVGEIKAAEGVEILGDKQTPVVSVALPRTEAEEAAAAEGAAASCRRSGDDQGEEGRRHRRCRSGQSRRQSCAGQSRRQSRSGQSRREGRRQEGRRASREEEIVLTARSPCGALPPCPRMEDCASHRGLGKSRRGIRADAAQRGFSAGRTAGRALAGGLELRKKVQARVAKTERDGRRVLLCQPQTFMNLSGEAVGALVEFYRVALSELLVVVDDADLPLGEIRLRPGGSSGGHHGLESIEQHLGTREFARLRIGIGRKDGDARDYGIMCLGRFEFGRNAVMEKVLARAATRSECWLAHGITESNESI